jgi:hypothetical protein
MPVGEMLRRMSSAELTEWMAYYSIQSEQATDSPIVEDAEAHTQKLKAALFKGAK